MIVNRKSLILLCFIISLAIICPFKETKGRSVTSQRLVPFIGMIVDYELEVYMEPINLWNITLENWTFPAKWTVTWEQYNQSTPDIFISNLTIESPYLVIAGLGHTSESGVIIENITSREVIRVNLENTLFLKILADLFYSSNQPTYTPFYINTTGLNIDDQINVYNYSMRVIESNLGVQVADYGFKDVWIVQKNITNRRYEHFIRLAYDNHTGVLVGGLIESKDHGTDKFYRVFITCQYTNALTRHYVIIRTNELLALLVACVPLVPLSVRIIRMKEIKGGL